MYEATRIIDTLEGGAILVILIAVRGVNRERAINEEEVVRGRDLIIGREAIRHTLIREIETIEEGEVERGVEVTSATRTQQCQRK